MTMPKYKLPRQPYFVHVDVGDPEWERWNYLVDGYAVVGRVTRARATERAGQFWFVATDLRDAGKKESSGYRPTLKEAQDAVAEIIDANYYVPNQSAGYCGA